MRFFKLLFVVFLVSCSNNDDSPNEELTNPCRLINASIAPLIYDDYINYYSSFDSPSISTGLTEERVLFEYDDLGRITTISGGPTRIPTGSGIDWIFTYVPNYEVSYENGTIIIDSQVQTFAGDNKNRFVIVDGKIISRTIVTTTDYFIYNVTEFTYEYFDNYVAEYSEENLCRTFHFEDDNLVRVECLFYDITDILVGKSEINFSEFDNNTNLLKDLYFVDGAFYLAFSKNTYGRITFINYQYLNGEFESDGPFLVNGFNFGLNEDGTNAIFQQECDE